jgi:hypothetical protein
MKTIKSLALAALLAVSANVSADEITRQYFTTVCEAKSQEAGNNYPMSNAVCNCSAQAISYVLSANNNRYEQWVIDDEHPLVQRAIDHCVSASNEDAYNFLLYFGSERASVR